MQPTGLPPIHWRHPELTFLPGWSAKRLPIPPPFIFPVRALPHHSRGKARGYSLFWRFNGAPSEGLLVS